MITSSDKHQEEYKVYKHTFPNGKVYIGITSQSPEKRWAGGSGYCSNPRMYNAIKKYGWDNVTHEILYAGLTQEQAYEKEIELIANYQSTLFDKGYNRHIGGAYMPDNYIDYEGCLIDYEKIKSNPFMKLLLIRVFQSALGYEYFDTIERYFDNKLIAVENIPRKKEPDIELVEILYEKYKGEDELKTLIDKAKQILEGK